MMANQSENQALEDSGNYLGMSAYELAYLVKGVKGAPIESSLRALRLNPDELSDDALAVAASSLFARQLLVVDGENLKANGIAALILYVLIAATRWTEIGLASEDRLDGAIYFEAPELSVLCQPRMLGAWLVTLQPKGVTTAAVIRQIIDAQADNYPESGVVVATRTLDSEASLLIHRTRAGEWEIGSGEPGTPLDEQAIPATSAEVDATLAELFGVESTEAGR